MRALFGIAWRSAWNRRFTLALTVLSIALSTFLLLGVERIRTELRQNFSSSVSGTDLIVGARTGSTQLLLYSVFRIGAATNNVQWKSVQALTAHPGVDWVVPLSLGDSHRGAGDDARVCRAFPLRQPPSAAHARRQALQRSFRCGGRRRGGRQAGLS